MKAVHILTILGALFGGVRLIDTLMKANTAPQQAAGAALAAAIAVIPYCFARAVEIMASPRDAELKRVNETLATHTRLLADLANRGASSDKAEPEARG